jgi:threonine dehydrogenase-like Zn-dependent dehydrogenase
MKALVFHGLGDIRLEEVKIPKIKDETDAIVKITCSAICGTDLHFIRGTVGPMEKGTILGHEAVGIVDKIGKNIRNLKEGDRVVIPSTVACGSCLSCKNEHYSQCQESNPNGPEAGTVFYGGPKDSGPLQGCQAEYVRVPFANINLVKLPDEVTDDQAIILSDIFPTAYFAADMAKKNIPGKTVAVLGCGPVGQLAIASCKLLGAARIFAIDSIPYRLNFAKSQGAECINFRENNPLDVIKELTKGALADVVIDAVGVDAEKYPDNSRKIDKEFQNELENIAPKTNPNGKLWQPGSGPSQALRDSVELAAKNGIISIIGVYPSTAQAFPIGKAMNKNLSVVMGNCPHKKYIPLLLQYVRSGMIEPSKLVSQTRPITEVLEAYKNFDLRQDGWIKVALKPSP